MKNADGGRVVCKTKPPRYEARGHRLNNNGVSHMNNNITHVFFFITTDSKVKPFIWNKGTDWLENSFLNFIEANYSKDRENVLPRILKHIKIFMEESPFKKSLVQIINKWLADLERHKNMIRIG